MQMQRLIGIVALVGGIVLLVMGLRAVDSFGSQLSKFFTGSPTDRAIWMTFGGIALILVGAGTTLIPNRSGK